MSTTIPAGAVRVVPDGTSLVQVEVAKIGHYAKFLIPLAAAALVTFKTDYGQGGWLFIALSIGIAVAQAFGVLALGNTDTGFFKYSKFWVSLAATVAQAVLGYVGANGALDSITPTEWATIGLSLTAALGTVAIPNDVKSVTALVPTSKPIVAAAPPAPVAAAVEPVTATIVSDTAA